MDCKGLDAQVVRPDDRELTRLLQEFVPVRLTSFKGVDMNRFRFAQLRAEGKFTKERLFQYPLPENIGLTLDVDANNVVKAALPHSPAQ